MMLRIVAVAMPLKQPIDRIDHNGPVFVSTRSQGIEPLLDRLPIGQVRRAIALHVRCTVFRVDNEPSRTGAEGGFANPRWAVNNALGGSQVDLVQYGRGK